MSVPVGVPTGVGRALHNLRWLIAAAHLSWRVAELADLDPRRNFGVSRAWRWETYVDLEHCGPAGGGTGGAAVTAVGGETAAAGRSGGVVGAAGPERFRGRGDGNRIAPGQGSAKPALSTGDPSPRRTFLDARRASADAA